MISRLPSWTLVVLLAVPMGAVAEVRTWTDKQGQTTRGEFVRVHEGRVVLKSGTKTLMVPLSGFSQADQEYIEAQLNRKANKDGDSQPVRIWTDMRGNQIVAAFLRMEETTVVLLDSGKPRSIAFMDISQPDRVRIKDLLRSQGQEQAMTALEQHEEQALKAAEAAREAARQSAPAPAASPANTLLEEMRQRQEAQRQENEQRRQAAIAADQERRQREEEQRRQRDEENRQRLAEQQQKWKEQEQQRQQQMQERLANLSTGPTMVTEWRCSSCNKEVPESVTAGGNCPHCGVYFEYTQSPTGQRQYASSDGSGGSSRYRISGRAIKGVVFLVILVCGGIAGLWKKINGG